MISREPLAVARSERATGVSKVRLPSLEGNGVRPSGARLETRRRPPIRPAGWPLGVPRSFKLERGK